MILGEGTCNLDRGSPRTFVELNHQSFSYTMPRLPSRFIRSRSYIPSLRGCSRFYRFGLYTLPLKAFGDLASRRSAHAIIDAQISRTLSSSSSGIRPKTHTRCLLQPHLDKPSAQHQASSSFHSRHSGAQGPQISFVSCKSKFFSDSK